MERCSEPRRFSFHFLSIKIMKRVLTIAGFIHQADRFAVRGSRHQGICALLRPADGPTMRNSELHLESGPTMTEYARTLSVLTIFCLSAFALVAAASTGALTRFAGYLT